jgi:hypothetical protein
MSIAGVCPQILDFFGTPLGIEPSPGQLSGLQPRWLIAKAEANDRGTNRRFVVTNRPGAALPARRARCRLGSRKAGCAATG